MERNFQYFSLTPIHTHTGRRRRRRRRKQNDACADEAQRRSRRRKMQRITILSAAVSFAAKISLRDRRSLSGIKHLSSSSPPSATSTSTSSSSSTSSSHPSSLAAPASPSCSDSDLLPANRLLVHGVHLFECPVFVLFTIPPDSSSHHKFHSLISISILLFCSSSFTTSLIGLKASFLLQYLRIELESLRR